MIPTYIISGLIGFVIFAASTIAVSRFVDWLYARFPFLSWPTTLDHLTSKRPQPPKPKASRKGLGKGDGVTSIHGGSNR